MIVRLAPESDPAAAGVQASWTVQDAEGASDAEVLQAPPVTVTPVPAAEMAEGAVELVPEFVTVTVSVDADPTVAELNDPDEKVSDPAGGVSADWIDDGVVLTRHTPVTR